MRAPAACLDAFRVNGKLYSLAALGLVVGHGLLCDNTHDEEAPILTQFTR